APPGIGEPDPRAGDAAEGMGVRSEPLPTVVELADAIAPGAPLVWSKATGNIAAEIRHGAKAAAESAFKRAAHVVSLDIVTQRLAPSPLEPRAVLASYDKATKRITLRVSSQCPTGVRDDLAEAVLGIPPQSIRV